MNKQAMHKKELEAQKYTRNLERHHAHMARNQMRMTPIACAIRMAFLHGWSN